MKMIPWIGLKYLKNADDFNIVLKTIKATDTPEHQPMVGLASALCIWLCACVRYWPDRGLVLGCVTKLAFIAFPKYFLIKSTFLHWNCWEVGDVKGCKSWESLIQVLGPWGWGGVLEGLSGSRRGRNGFHFLAQILPKSHFQFVFYPKFQSRYNFKHEDAKWGKCM